MKKIVAVVISICMIVSFITVTAASDMVEYSLLDGSVRLLGRGEILADGDRTFNWPNAGFEFKFNGTKADVYVTVKSGVYANVQVDGGEPVRKLISSGWNTMCSNLGEGEHTVRFVRSSEAHAGTMKMSKMRADAKPEATTPLEKRIEFIGDSYTTGFGNVYTGKYNWDTHEDTDNWYAYDAYVARMIDDYDVENRTYDEDFGAEFNVTAHQGKGLYVNGYDANQPFDYTVADEFEFEDVYFNWGNSVANNMSSGSQWNFARYQPQLVVIWLGTNDYAGSHYATEAGVTDVPAAFKNAYVEFIDRVRSVYPTSTILCMAKPDQAYGEQVEEAVKRAGGAANKVHFLSLTSFKGTSLAHPSKEEAKEIAYQVVEKIYEIDEACEIWNTSATSDESTITIKADYNTNEVYIYGKTGVGNEQVGAMVLRPETELSTVSDSQVVSMLQDETNSAGEYDFIFNADAIEGGYTFYMNSWGTGGVQNKSFEFECYVPGIIVKDGDAVVDKMSDITGDSIDLTIKGFDIAEGFKGVVVVSQYNRDKMLSAETIEASVASVAFGDEIEENIKLKDGADKIRIMYINTATYAPVIGQYEIK